MGEQRVQCTNAGQHGVQCTREYSVLMQVNMGCSVPGVWEEKQVAGDPIMTLHYCGVVSPSA